MHQVRLSPARRRSRGGAVVASAMLALSSLGLPACGGQTNTHSSAAAAAHPLSSFDRADPEHRDVLQFGHLAGGAEKAAITTLITSYYTAALHEDGTAACGMIVPSVSRSVAEDYGQSPGPMYLRGGRTCAEVMARLFRHHHNQLARGVPNMRITQVRVKTKGGFAVLRFGMPPEREMTIVRQGGTWYVSSLIDSALF